MSNGPVYAPKPEKVPHPDRFPGDDANKAHYKSLAAGRKLMAFDTDNPADAEQAFADWYCGDPVNNISEF